MKSSKENQKKKEDKKVKILYFDPNTYKTINKKKLIGLVILLLLILFLIITYIVYAANEDFRKFMDEHLLRKQIEENNLTTITIEDYDKSNIFAFSNHIAILKENILQTYNAMGKMETELKVEISNPILENNGKYLIIAEKEASKAYMIADNMIKWEKELEGNIARVSVNANGYSSIILTGTAYKSVIVLFDDSGNELFRIYLSNTLAVDSSVSDDNKYLSYAEINTSGTLIQSNIKIVSIDKAKEMQSESTIYTYNAPSNDLILNINYQNKTKLTCMYDNSVHTIKDSVDNKVTDLDITKEKITFSSIELNNFTVKNIEGSSGLFNTKTTLKIINTDSQKENTYNFDGVTKELYCSGDKIALNLGSEVHFVDTNGWLIKKYTSSQEIRKIILSEELAGIVYRNKIEIIKF